MAVETQYNIVKVNELREITVAQGVDELIINDLDSSPIETKKITAENFALSIKDYILPIATEEVLGGIKVGNGLTINPITGVLSNDILILDDLQDVIILNPDVGHVLRYNGNQWINQAEGGFDNIVAGDGLSGGGTEGTVTLHVNAGPGLRIENDMVRFNDGKGLAISEDKVDVQLNSGLVISNNLITIVTGPGIAVSQGQVTAILGNGLEFNGQAIAAKLSDAGFLFDNGHIGLNLGNGLHFFNNQLAVNIGTGLKFTNGVLEGNSVLPDLNDVEVTNPQDDQILQYNGTSNVWENVDVATLNLDDLGDVTVSNPQESEALVYTGTHWENAIVRGVNDVIYKKVHNARISLTATEPYPINRSSNLVDWQDRTQVTSQNLYLHPYRGSEVGLWDSTNMVWYLASFDGVRTFPLSALSSPNTNYDVYLYNNGTVDVPSLNMDFVQWPDDNTPPTRGTKDGITVKQGADTYRWMGAVRTTSAGTSGYDLGGLVTASDKSVTPYCFIANSDSLYEVNLSYVFGTAWSGVSRPPGSSGWGCPSAYLGSNPLIEHPQINFLTVTDDPVTCNHSVQSNGGNYAASNLGFDLPDDVLTTNNAPGSGGEQKNSFNIWTNFTYSTTQASGGTGILRRAVYPGKHRITYWFDSCGGVTHAGKMGSGFTASFYA